MEIQDLVKIAVPIIGIPLAGKWFLRHHFASHNHAKRLLSFKSLDDCMVELENIRNAKDLHLESEWSLFQNLVHCSQSIEFSIAGYPQNKPEILQKTLGSMVFHQFEKQGYMRHNRNKPIPGAAPIETEGMVDQAVERLSKAVNDFENCDQELMPHYAYGKLSKKEYVKAHCMHMADHFAMMVF